MRDFGIKIHGRTIAVEHSESGHVCEYVWFRDPPYLRLPLVRENELATIPVAEIVANAKKAAMLELENASLLQAQLGQFRFADACDVKRGWAAISASRRPRSRKPYQRS